MPAVAAFPAPRSLRWLILAAVGVSAVLLGYLTTLDTGFLRQDVPSSVAGLGAAVAGLALAAVVLRQPQAGLLLLSAFVYLHLSQVLVRHHRLPSLLQLLAFPLLLSAWTHRSAAERRRVMLSPQALLLVLYTLVLLLSTTFARDRALADRSLAENGKALAVYFLVALLAASTGLVRRAVWVLIGCGALLGGLALVQVLSVDFSNEYGGLARIKLAHVYGEAFEPRIAGPLGDPNFFAQILVVLVPLALYVAWHERGLGRILAFAGAAVAAAAVVLTYSRGGALALATVLALSLVSRRIPVRQAAAAGAASVLLLLFVPTDFARRLTTLEQFLPGSELEVLHPDSSFQKRRLLAAAAWTMFLDHPGLGVGAGNYTAHFDEYAGEVGSAAREYEDPAEANYPHNLYLEIAAETGLLGLAVFGSALAVSFVSLRRARAAFLAAGDARTAALARGFETALVGYLVSGVFLHGHFPRYLWLLLGFVAALTTLAPRHEK